MKLVPRQERLLQCLLLRPHSRHELRDKIGSENVPDVVSRLRNKGLDIPCDRKKIIDRDGIETKPGTYRLPASERQKAEMWLSGAVTPLNCSTQSTVQE